MVLPTLVMRLMFKPATVPHGTLWLNANIASQLRETEP